MRKKSRYLVGSTSSALKNERGNEEKGEARGRMARNVGDTLGHER